MDVYKLSPLSSSYLDIIRIISVQMVVIGHGISFCSVLTFLRPPKFMFIQNFAVILFFILSGFLITYTSYRKSQSNSYCIREYFFDRFSRIFSGLIPALIFVTILDYFYFQMFPNSYSCYQLAYNVQTFIGNLFMLQDYPLHPFDITITSFGSARPLWTLAIEWWIYMTFGWIFFRKKLKYNFYLYVAILLFLLIVPLYNFSGGRGNGLFLMWLFGSGIFLLLNGNIVAFRRNFHNLFIILVCLFIGTFFLLHSNWEVYNTLFAAIMASTILFSIRFLDSLNLSISILMQKFIQIIAGFSFTLYLIHYSIFALFVNFVNIFAPELIFVIAYVLSNFSALLLGLFGEMKHRNLSQYLKSTFY